MGKVDAVDVVVVVDVVGVTVWLVWLVSRCGWHGRGSPAVFPTMPCY